MDFNLFVARMSIVVDFSKLQTAFESVQGFLLDGEGYALTLLAMEGPGEGAIVEIGSFMGRSTCWLAEGTKRAGREKVYAVDHFTGSPEHQAGAQSECEAIVKTGSTLDIFRKNICAHGFESVVEPIVSPSLEAARNWDGPIRLLFIDGDHSYESTRDDFLAWSPYVINHGWVAFHDIGNAEGSTRFYEELDKGDNEYEAAGTVGSLGLAFKNMK